MQKDLGKAFAILSKFRGTYNTFYSKTQFSCVRESVFATLQQYAGIKFIEDINLTYKEIIKWIDKGIPIIVGVNLKEIFYSRYYMERDWNHWFLIIGYKEKQGLVTVLDNTQFQYIGNKYEEFNIPFDMLKRANKSYIKRYDKKYSVIAFEKNRDCKCSELMNSIIEEYCRLNLENTDGYRQYILFNMYMDMLKDEQMVQEFNRINSQVIEGSLLNEAKKKIININKYRRIFFNEIRRYMEASQYNEECSDNFEVYVNQCTELNKLWQNQIINTFVKVAKGYEPENIITNKIIYSEKTIQDEVKCFFEYLKDKEIKSVNTITNDFGEKSECFRYENNQEKIVVNKMSGDFKGEANFEFNGNRTYNYWDMDEAPKVIFDIQRFNNKEFEIIAEPEILFRNKTNVEIGLIFRDFSNGSVQMIGIENGEKLVVSEIGVTGFKYEITENEKIKLFMKIKKDLIEIGINKGEGSEVIHTLDLCADVVNASKPAIRLPHLIALPRR